MKKNKCPNCGYEYSENSSQCDKCGHQLIKNEKVNIGEIVKRIIIGSIIIVLGLFFTIIPLYFILGDIVSELRMILIPFPICGIVCVYYGIKELIKCYMLINNPNLLKSMKENAEDELIDGMIRGYKFKIIFNIFMTIVFIIISIYLLFKLINTNFHDHSNIPVYIIPIFLIVIGLYTIIAIIRVLK